MSISTGKKYIGFSQKIITQEQRVENTDLNKIDELDTVNHWLTCVLPFVSKLQNEEDKARAALFEKELKK